jgi:hypothetical protein
MGKRASYIKTTTFILLPIVILILLVEFVSLLALHIRPTGNPLAYNFGETELLWYSIPENSLMQYDIKADYSQLHKSWEFSTVVQTNNMGFREDKDFVGQKLDIAFVGDSFTMGHGVNLDLRYTDLIKQKITDQNVMTLAPAAGHSPPHYYFYLKNNPELIPNMLVIGLFPANDLENDMSDVKLLENSKGELIGLSSKNHKISSEGGLIKKEELDQYPLWKQFLRSFNTGRVFLLARYKLQQMFMAKSKITHSEKHQNVIREIQQEVSQHDRGVFNKINLSALDFVDRINSLVTNNGGEVIVLYIPYGYWVGNYPSLCPYSKTVCQSMLSRNDLGDAIALSMKEYNIEFIDPTEEFRKAEESGVKTYFPMDAHWTPAGHAVAADAVYARIKKKLLLPPAIEAKP